MSPSARQLLDEALQLPVEERSALISGLIESLDAESDVDVQAAWNAEIARRIEEVRSGEVATIPWAEARRMILGATDAPAAD